jgi:hypothetical protein
MLGPTTTAPRKPGYVILVCGEDGVVRSSFPLPQVTDGEALAAAQRILDPGQNGEVWADNRFVGRVSPGGNAAPA